jgi:hypothetical protein
LSSFAKTWRPSRFAAGGRVARTPLGSRHALALIATLVSGCSAPRAPGDWVSVREVTPPFLTRLSGSDPALAADSHGRVALTFVTSDSTGKNVWLSISRDSGLTFSPPRRVNLRDGSVDSYPESRPVVVFGPSGELAVAWSEHRPDPSPAADLMVRASPDGGASLGPPVVVNDDRNVGEQRLEPLTIRAGRVQSGAAAPGSRDGPHWNGLASHGFPAMTFLSDGSLFAAWLDGREAPESVDEPEYSTIYCASSPDGGLSWTPNLRLADSICSCCRPMAVSDSAGGIAVAYRRAASDLRDPALAVSLDRGRSFSLDTIVSPDRWLLHACPAQGPVLSWNRLAGGHYAWYTGAGRSGIYLIPWHAEHGASGVKRPLMDSLLDARHPRLAALGRATLIAVEARPRDDSSRTVLAVRALDADGTLTPWSFLGARAKSGWLAALDHRTALACWVEREGMHNHVRVARLRRRALRG